jgi:cytoskeletal protein CcmA (bactofilin family)
MWGYQKKRWNAVPQDENLTFLGKGVVLNGMATFEGTVRIDSRFEGKLRVNGTLVVGTDAIIKGAISAQSVVNNGKIFADITASQKVRLMKAAVIVGDVTTPSFVMEDGAHFHGQCNMGVLEDGKWVEETPVEESKTLSHDLAAQRARLRTHHLS